MNYAEEIKRAVSMRDIANAYGFEADRIGNIRCPFHNDSRPSMHIYDGTRGWWCFVCNSGGDVIDFVRKYFSLSFLDACKKINEDFNLSLPIGAKLTLEQQIDANKKAKERKMLQQIKAAEYERVLNAYHTALDRWIYLDNLRRKSAPHSSDEPIKDEYIYACINISEAGYIFDLASQKLSEFEANR